jgi:short-subunit dehydrogenase
LSEALGGAERVLPIAVDVTDAAGMEAMAARVVAEVGVPDVVVANAGIGLDARFTEMGDEALRRVLEVNVFGVVRTLRPFVTGMVERGSGRFVVVSSIVGKRGTPHYAAYAASKFALHGMADALAAELHGSGVTVGLVCPTSTSTEFQDHLLREGVQQNRSRPRTHTAESVARAIVRMARSKRREKILSFEGKLLAVADAIAPRLVDALLHRMMTRRS